MAFEGKRKCDICGNEIHGDNYFQLGLNDMRLEDEKPRIDDTCLNCFDRLRVYIRHGMPKMSEIRAKAILDQHQAGMGDD